MPQDFVDWLGIADTVAMALLAVRLSFTGLFRAYPALFAHTIVESLQFVFVLTFPLAPRLYGLFFMGTTPVRWILWTLIGLGLYRLTLKPRTGLLTAGRWMVWAAAAASFVLIALTLKTELAPLGKAGWLLAAVLLADRTVTSVLAILILTLCAFLAWFVVPMRRNCAYLCMGFGVIFVTRSAAHFVRNALGDDVTGITNIIQAASSAATFLTLAILLNRDGETQTAYVPRRPSQEQLEEAVRRAKEAGRKADREP